jgi:general secretion pathway protein C
MLIIMQNTRYHIVNTASVVFFSFITAITISQFIKLKMTPVYSRSFDKEISSAPRIVKKTYEDYKAILDSSFFKLASENDAAKNSGDAAGLNAANLDEFQLLGTISGPASIARALIKKRSEKDSEIFKLWSDVYGFKLVRIDNLKIFLKRDKTVSILDMYPKVETAGSTGTVSSAGSNGSAEKTSQTISRSEVQQKLKDVDSAFEGMRAGPYKVNDKIEGYKIFRVSPSNYLYKLGLRSGDIAKRVNGHPIDSTEKLMGLWNSFQGSSRITVDIERGGKIQTFDLNITD